MPFTSFCRLAASPGSCGVLRAPVRRAVSKSSPVRVYNSSIARGAQRHGITQMSRKADSSFPHVSTFVYATLAVGCVASVAVSIAAKPHLLESDQWDVEDDGAYERYCPSTVLMSLQMAEDVLYWDSNSHPIQTGSNILRYDRVRVASNMHVEDYVNFATGSSKDGLQWFMAGIFDGHAGWQTSEALNLHLTNYVVRHIAQNLPPDTDDFADVPPHALNKAMKDAFIELDHDLMAEAAAALTESRYMNDAIHALEPALAGSCALLSYYNSDTQILKVACTGDSRAVLGRRSAAGTWEAIPLSEDQTGASPTEQARLHREHPDEPDMLKNNRLLGLAVTRAFGDSRWKWPRHLQESARDRFAGPQLRDPLLTPPYLTAEPVVTSTKIQPERGDFLILASDGLWDELSSAQAVDLIGRWLRLKSNDTSKPAPAYPRDASQAQLALKESILASRHQQGPRVNPAGRRAYSALGGPTQRQEKDYVVKDGNAAVHLVRNALGGGDEDRLCGVLGAQAPFARGLRDDITVQVIFFGEDPNVITL